MNKNVLMISIDDFNDWNEFSNGYQGTIYTPNLSRLMESGTTFAKAYAQVAICNASRASIMLGKDPHNARVLDNATQWYELNDVNETMPAVFRDAGYYTATLGKVFHEIDVNTLPHNFAERMFDEHPLNSGIKGDLESEYTSNNSIGLSQVGALNPDVGALKDEVTADYAVNFLNNSESLEDPFYLAIGLERPHLPWTVPQKYLDLYPLENIVVPDLNPNDLDDVPNYIRFIQEKWGRESHEEILDANAWASHIQGYLASITYMDEQLGRVIDSLEDNGLMDDTIISVWSDHGYHLGEKDSWRKFTLWEEATNAPMIIRDPDSNTNGEIIDDVVNLVDIYPTLLELAGIDRPEHLDGNSLAPLISGDIPNGTYNGVSFTWMYGSFAVRTDKYRYIRYQDGSEELYDMENDFDQITNLASDPNYENTKKRLLRQIVDRYDIVLDNGNQSRTFTANEKNNILIDRPQDGDIFEGGDGNDAYFINNRNSQIVELPGEGIDTVYITKNRYILPENVENAVISLHSNIRKFTGNDSNNIITVSNNKPHRIEAMGGDDIVEIANWERNDTVYGGSGADYIYSGRGNDRVFGGSGNGSPDGNDTLDGWNGNDFLFGEEGNDSLIGQSGKDTLIGGSGDDILEGGSGNDSLIGQSGKDTLIGGSGDDILEGGINNDNLTGNSGKDKLKGGDNNDTLNGGGGEDTLYGGSGNDNLSGSAGNDTLIGGDGNDSLNGGSERDNLDGASGDDTLIGGSGDDTLIGNSDLDSLQGGSGNDSLDGGSEDDTLIGGSGDDILTGNSDNDNLIGGSGNDSLDGGSEDDTLNGDSGDDTLIGNSGNDLLYGGFQQDNLDGGSGNDTLSGDSGDDFLSGGEGNDDLSGGNGNDILIGGDGNDILRGRSGNDTLTGGKGSNVFVIGPVKFQGSDTIQDFTQDLDKLFLAGNITFADLTITSNEDGTTLIQNGTETIASLIGVDPMEIDINDFE